VTRETTLPNLPLILLQVREDVVARFRHILNHFGVTEQQWRILRVLRFDEPMEPKEICETCLFLSPSLAGMLARMEADGLVRKERVETDLRRVLVYTTDKSKTLVDAAMPLITEQYRLLEQHIGGDALRDLFDALDRMSAIHDADVPLVPLPKKSADNSVMRNMCTTPAPIAGAGKLPEAAPGEGEV
jgi:homoprotocatechuate degradation regulator HpaR